MPTSFDPNFAVQHREEAPIETIHSLGPNFLSDPRLILPYSPSTIFHILQPQGVRLSNRFVVVHRWYVLIGHFISLNSSSLEEERSKNIQDVCDNVERILTEC